MSDRIYFVPDGMRNLANKLAFQEAQLTELLTQTSNDIEATQAIWQGPAASDFTKLMTQWHADANNIHQILAEVKMRLQHTAQAYESMDSQLARGFAIDVAHDDLERRSHHLKIVRDSETDDTVNTAEETSILRIRLVEEPLTLYSLTSIISALTDLSTKYWLIAKGRFPDLIEYMQTHSGRFVEEAGVIVTKIAYNSPMNMDWKLDLSAPSVAEALITTIDGITQVRKRLEHAELENQAKAQEVKHAEQRAEHEEQMALFEREKQQLEIEKQRLELLEKQLEVQKKGIEYALELAGKVVNTLHPEADSAARAMEIQALLPNLVQLQNLLQLQKGEGLELVSITLQKNEGKGLSSENG